MFENLDTFLVGIAIGIRFRNNFNILDNFGYITDLILFSKNSLFGPDIFPKLSTNLSEQRILINEDTEDKMVFDKANAILEINFGEGKQFNNNDLSNLIDAYNEKIINGVLSDLSVTRILRVGFIRKYEFDDEQLIKSFLDRTTGNETKNIQDISLRFSRRISVGESLTKRDKNDYKNVIYTISKNIEQEHKLNVAIDYQRFYEPNLSTSTQIKFFKFVKAVDEYNSSNFSSWLRNYFKEA